MKAKNKKHSNKKDKLESILREWDCRNLDEAKHLAKEDEELRELLRECGIK